MWNRPSVWLAATMMCVWALPPRIVAQDAESEQAGPATPAAQLDIELLLDTQQLRPASVQDDAWTIQPQPGRKFIVLPVRLSPIDEPVTLGSPPFSLRGGGR